MEDKRMDELLNEEIKVNDFEIKETEKIINQKMNRRIIGKSLVVSIVVVIIVICLALGVFAYHHYLQEKNAFHLSDWEMVVEVPWNEDIKQEQLEVMNAYTYVDAYITLFYPGFISTKTQAAHYEPYDITYGTYQIEAEIIDLFDLTASNGNIENASINRTKVHISWSNIWLEDSIPSLSLDETKFQMYRQNGYSLGEAKVPEEDLLRMKVEVEQLPKTSIVMMDVMLNDAMTIDALLEYQRMHLDSRVVYVTTHYSDWADFEENEYEYSHPYGFNLFEGMNIVDVRDEYKDKYPYLTLSGNNVYAITNKANFWHYLPDYNEEMLTQHYLSCMKLLVNNDVAKWYKDDLKLIIEDVEENGVSVKGFRIYATQDDALELFENANAKSIVLQDVKLSKYQK